MDTETSVTSETPPLKNETTDLEGTALLEPDVDESRSDLSEGSDQNLPRDARSEVLGNEDLLSLVFSFEDWCSTTLGLSTTSRDRKLRDLLQASFTCRDFFYPAIRTLWKSMDSMVPLVKLVEGVVKENGMLTTTTVIMEEDLDRFDFYSPFVQRFDLCALKGNGISPHVLPILYQYRPLGLLPSLKVLKISQFSFFQPADLPFLISIIPMNGLSNFIIENVQRHTSPSKRVFASSILQSVQMKSRRLTSLTLKGGLDSGIFPVVKSIESLRTVFLDFSMTSFVPGKGSRTRSHKGLRFSNLVDLHLAGDLVSVDAIAGWVGYTPQLRNLKVSLTPAPRNQSLAGSFLSLVNEITEDHDHFLESLVIDVDSDPGNPLFRLTDEAFEYFTRPTCKKLKTLRLSSVYDLSNTTFSQVFPTPHESLESLDIRSGFRDEEDRDGSWNNGFKGSLGSLEIIRDTIPNLKHLCMPIYLNTNSDDFSFVPKESQAATRTCHGLEELVLKPFGIQPPAPGGNKYTYPDFHFPSESLADMLVIARYIDYLFPHLKKLDTQEIRPFVAEKWLDGLEAAVKQFADVRMMVKGDCVVCRT